jgi:FAD binding domain
MGFLPTFITLVCRASVLLLYLTFSRFPVACAHSVVVYPDSTEDVVKIVNVARKYRMPIIPYSGGTSVEGHFSGVRILPSYSAMPPRSQTRRSFWLCSGRMGVYVSICLEWTKSSLSMARSSSTIYNLRYRLDSL